MSNLCRRTLLHLLTAVIGTSRRRLFVCFQGTAVIGPAGSWEAISLPAADERAEHYRETEKASIHTWGDGKTWSLYAACYSARHWTATKARLAFCAVTQDGDDEGVLRLHQLPTADQAAVIREVLGIRKRQTVSEATLERLKAFTLARNTHGETSSGSGEAGDIV